MKYVARVMSALRSGIHTVGELRGDHIAPVRELPLPNRVEIEVDGDSGQSCMMYRYKDDGTFCGDTWHENLANAFHQANYEYGLTENDFTLEYEQPGT